jgi:hypothetical protein
MRPPICECCGLDFRGDDLYSETSGGLVRFADYEPLPEGMVGHPPGLAWFCSKHITAARGLTMYSLGEALKRLED